jgi:hypothetical protein
VPASHLKGVLRHLGKGLDHPKNHWGTSWKKAWNLPGLGPRPSDLKDIGRRSRRIHRGLPPAGRQGHRPRARRRPEANSILGNLYGWFFIASVLIGTIVGAFFGGAGAIPGASLARPSPARWARRWSRLLATERP